jgi:hypothetical protein
VKIDTDLLIRQTTLNLIVDPDVVSATRDASLSNEEIGVDVQRPRIPAANNTVFTLVATRKIRLTPLRFGFDRPLYPQNR